MRSPSSRGQSLRIGCGVLQNVAQVDDQAGIGIVPVARHLRRINAACLGTGDVGGAGGTELDRIVEQRDDDLVAAQPVVANERGAQGSPFLVVAMGEENGAVGRQPRRDPGHQFGMVGVGGIIADGADTGAHRDLLAMDAHPPSPPTG